MGRLTYEKLCEILQHVNRVTFILDGVGEESHSSQEVHEAIKELQRYKDLEEAGRLIEVVRCKDCWRYDTGAGYDGWGLCELYDQDRKDNDYCSFGELRELEGE